MTFYVNTPNQGTLNMREKPNTKSFIINRIPNGTIVEGETDGEWTKITYAGETGYVMTKFVSSEVQPSSAITKEDLQRVYNSLKETVQLIERILK